MECDAARVWQRSFLLRPVAGAARINDILVDVPLRRVCRPGYDVIELEVAPAVLGPLFSMHAIDAAELKLIPHPILVFVICKPVRAVASDVRARGKTHWRREYQTFLPLFASSFFFKLSSRESISSRTSVDLGSTDSRWLYTSRLRRSNSRVSCRLSPSACFFSIRRSLLSFLAAQGPSARPRAGGVRSCGSAGVIPTPHREYRQGPTPSGNQYRETHWSLPRIGGAVRIAPSRTWPHRASLSPKLGSWAEIGKAPLTRKPNRPVRKELERRAVPSITILGP